MCCLAGFFPFGGNLSAGSFFLICIVDKCGRPEPRPLSRTVSKAGQPSITIQKNENHVTLVNSRRDPVFAKRIDVLNMKKSRFKIITNPENCVGCRLCQMRCSFRFTKEFSFFNSRIEVVWDENQHHHGITFHEMCDACGLCVRSCVYEALVLEYDGKRGTDS